MYGTSAILLTWLILAGIFVGIGLPVSRVLQGGYPRNENHLVALFWLGWAAVIVFLQVWHFFAPVNFSALLILMAIASAGLVLDRGTLKQAIHSIPGISPWFLALFCLFTIWLANRAMGPLWTYDAGIYHLQNIQWNSAYPIVPGLGNLHVRLAFNSSYFLFLSLLNAGPWERMPHHIGNGLLLLPISWTIFKSIVRALPGRGPFRSMDFFYTLMAPAVLWHCFKDASTTSPDLPVFVVGVLIAGRLFSLLFLARENAEVWAETTFIVTLSAVGVCIKLSFLGLAASASLVAVGICLHRLRTHPFARVILPRLLLWTTVTGVALGPWIVRSVILSGYVAYPITVAPLPVRWKIPDRMAEDGVRWIRSWARQPNRNPDRVLGNRQWIRPWLRAIARHHAFDAVLPVVLGALFLPLAVVRSRKKGLSLAKLALFLFPPVLSLASWFTTAPDPRFGGAIFWYFCAASITLACRELPPRRVLITVWLVTALAIAMGIGHFGRYRLSYLAQLIPYRSICAIPEAKHHTFETASGVRINVPDSGDQCWNAPIPCTPYPNPHLALRDGSTFRGGFVLSQ